MAAIALLPGALMLYLALVGGGYSAGATGVAAGVAALALAAWLLFARRPLAGLSWPLALAAGALALLAAWTLISSQWSHAPARAEGEYVRVLLYLLVLLVCGLQARSAERVRLMLYGVAGAIVAACAVALVARTLPDVVLHRSLFELGGRLAHPLTYWNTLALFAGIGIVLLGHLTCDTREPRVVRVLAAAALPLLATVLYYTFSRGPTWATVVAIGVYVVIARPRALVCGALATAPAVLVCLLTANPPDALTSGHPLADATLSAGRHVFVTVLLAIAGAGVLRALLLPVDAWLGRVDLGGRLRARFDARQRLLGAVTVAGALLLLAGVATLQRADTVRAKIDQFGDTADANDPGTAGAGSSRLLDASSNGRRELWEVAQASFDEHPLRGDGAGAFGVRWVQERPIALPVENAHSLYLELLAELGLPGLLLAGCALLCLLGAFAGRARGPDRALYAALLAAGLAWSLHAAVDWDWEMPVVTLWLFALGGAALARGRAPAPEPASSAPLASAQTGTPETVPAAPLPAGTSETGAAAPLAPERSGARWALPIALRVAGAAACLALAVLPARLALSEARTDEALAAMQRHDCATATERARVALDVRPGRTLAHQVIAYCAVRERRWKAAADAYLLAAADDPGTWEPHYGAAVALARGGMDPRRQARLAAHINRLEPLTVVGAKRMGGATARSWRRGGREAPLLPPQERRQ